MSNTVPSAPPSSPPSSAVVDGVNGLNDGGREEGDVELAIFRRIRNNLSSNSLKNAAMRRLRGPTPLVSTIQDPLSMFRDAPDNSSDTATDSDGTTSLEPNSGSFPPSDVADTENDSAEPLAFTTGSTWRDAVIHACADLLSKSLEELQLEYAATSAAPGSSTTAFSTGFEPSPRDLGDFVIMATLRTRDPLSMQNASSWLFNLMDRNGSGFVLREEFVRYTPFIGPATDAAVAGIVFDELTKEQVRRSTQLDNAHDRRNQNRRRDYPKQQRRERNPDRKEPSVASNVRLRRNSPGPRRRSRSRDATRSNRNSANPNLSSDDSPADSSDVPKSQSDDLYPLDLALRFDTWKPFFDAILDKNACYDNDWSRVKSELGIDPSEVLIKSQGAIDHSDIFPTLGKLFLSQRYLVFMAAVGKNHYVARLGTIADISTGSIPFMLRDSFEIKLETETRAARDGLLTVVRDEPEAEGTKSRSSAGSREEDRETMSQHVGRLMRHFMAARKPLVFSLLEFRETRKRDNWVRLISEMVAAHKLHIHLGFGSSGRAVPSIPQGADESSVNQDQKEEEPNSKKNESPNHSKSGKSLNYLRSPFRNEPSPPLLAVAAHSNIVRYRALRRVTQKSVTDSLMIFSFPDQKHQLINWYAESVRAHERQSGRTWIGRALAAIRENMEVNECLYQAQDTEPFDVGRLGDAIGRFAELCAPLARVIQFLNYLFQWRNPSATILAILVCVAIAAKGLVNFVPAALVFFQAAWVVETKYNWLGLGMGRAGKEDAEKRQANVLEMVAQVHDVLMAAQNVLNRMNRELGKVQALFLWGCEDWQSWVAVGALCVVGFVLLVVPGRTLFLLMFFMFFFNHFLPPSNPGIRFWQTVPPRMDDRKVKKKKGMVARQIRHSKKAVRGKT